MSTDPIKPYLIHPRGNNGELRRVLEAIYDATTDEEVLRIIVGVTKGTWEYLNTQYVWADENALEGIEESLRADD